MTKVISLSDDAYDLLYNLKEEGESFSDVVRKVANNKKYTFMDFAGILKEDSVEWEKISRELEEERKKTKARNIKSFD